jgi:hypothetical protein
MSSYSRGLIERFERATARERAKASRGRPQVAPLT